MKNKPTLIVIILLLCLFIPATLYGTYLKFIKQDSDMVKEQIVYAESYYDELDDLIDTKKDGTRTFIEPFNILNKEYVFTRKNNLVYLESKIDGIKLNDYQAIKFYNTYLENNILFVKKNNKWGIIDLNNMVQLVPNEYDYLGLINKEKDNVLLSNIIIGLKDGFYNLYSLSDTFSKISSDFKDTIYTYNENQKIIVTKKQNLYYLYDFNGNNLLNYYEIKDISITNNFVAIEDTNNILYIFDRVPSIPIYAEFTEEQGNIKLEEQNDILKVYFNDLLYKDIELNSKFPL